VVKAVPGGGCVWADECTDKSDCTLARDARGCCSCLEPWPRSLVGLDKCLVGPQSTAPAGCAEDCHQVLCEACPPPPAYECLEDAPAKLWTCRVVYTK
jgi:hypothetical protein